MLETILLIGCSKQYSCKTIQGVLISWEQEEIKQPREQSLIVHIPTLYYRSTVLYEKLHTLMNNL
jgi:hypothetical protein